MFMIKKFTSTFYVGYSINYNQLKLKISATDVHIVSFYALEIVIVLLIYFKTYLPDRPLGPPVIYTMHKILPTFSIIAILISK